MRKISKNDFLAKLGKVKSAESVKQHVVYSSIHLDDNVCCGDKRKHKKTFKIIVNFIVNLFSAIATYCFFPKKPTINIVKIADN